MKRIIECVPNYSEGRNKAVIDRIVASIASVEGVKVLNVDPGEAFLNTSAVAAGPDGSIVAAMDRQLHEAGFDRITHCGRDFEGAVHTAYSLARPGDAVLLSPACASFDMFSCFEERGESFKDIVMKLGEKDR